MCVLIHVSELKVYIILSVSFDISYSPKPQRYYTDFRGKKLTLLTEKMEVLLWLFVQWRWKIQRPNTWKQTKTKKKKTVKKTDSMGTTAIFTTSVHVSILKITFHKLNIDRKKCNTMTMKCTMQSLTKQTWMPRTQLIRWDETTAVFSILCNNLPISGRTWW